MTDANFSTSNTRHGKTFPCPVCGGWDGPRGLGTRCFGYTSGNWCHCTREEHAGGLLFHPESSSYAHNLGGACNCGKEHLPAPTPPPRRSTKGPSKGHFYHYVDEDGKNLFDAVRLTPKGFSQGHFDAAGVWHPTIRGIRRVLYRLPELLKAETNQWVFIPEGEKDVDANRSNWINSRA